LTDGLRPVDLAEQESAEVSGRPDRPALSSFWWWLTLLTVSGLILRVVVVLLASGTEWVSGDGFGYSLQASQMVHGRLFLNPFSGRPDALHPPAWAAVLTAFVWLGGHTWLQQQLLACFIGTSTIVLIGLAARRIAGERAGLVAAGVAAVYAGLWVYERALLSETLVLPIVALMILIAYRFRDRPSAALATLLGTLCALLALIRSEQILLLPLLVVPLILAARQVEWRRRLRWLFLAVGALLVLLAPWTIYNLARFHQPVLLSTGFGVNAVGANCNSTYYGPYTGWSDIHCVAKGSKSHNAAVADSQNRQIGLTYAEHHLARLPLVLVAREGRAFSFWSPFQQTQLESQWRSQPPALYRPSFPRSDLWAGRLGLYSYWLLLVPAAVGALLLRRRAVPIYPLLAFLATIAITVAVSSGDTRYRAAAEVSIVVLAAIGIERLLPRRRPAPPDRAAREGAQREWAPHRIDRADVPTDVIPSAQRSSAHPMTHRTGPVP
jgi:4-amino-4-deoxy-L-arabinose transferase-like glycosyltransferase